MLATYSGQVSAETACEELEAYISIRGEDGSSYINKTSLNLIQIDQYNYNFTQVIAAPNDYGYYYGKLTAYDANNQADKETATTSEELWDPPCYLEIDDFSLVNTVTAIDHLKTQLTYHVEVSEHGDNACRNNSMIVSMTDASGTTFRK